MDKESIIILTEAPNFKGDEWKKTQYEKIGSTYVQIRSAVVEDKVIESVAFQKKYTYYAFDNEKYTAESIDYYVKEVETKIHGKYWIYSIHGIKFYIENHGYVVLADINYKGVKKEALRRIKNYDSLLDKKNTTYYVPTLKDIIKKYANYLHNRIGTEATDSEIENIDKSGNTSRFEIGDLAAIKENGKYIYVCIYFENVSAGTPVKWQYVRSLSPSYGEKTSADIYKLHSQDVKQNNDKFEFKKENIIESYEIPYPK